MEDLFNEPEKLPEYVEEAMMYKTMKYESFSRRDKEMQKNLEDRVKHFSKILKMKGEPKDYGQRVYLENKEFELEIYKQSESLLYSHKTLRYRTSLPKDKIPDDSSAAQKIAQGFLESLELTNKYAEFRSFEHSFGTTFKEEDEKPILIKTEAHVIYTFQVDNKPIIGPGAKIKVSLVEQGKVCGLLYFWRDLTEYEKWPLISPEEALKRFKDDKRFKDLSSTTASVTIENMQFGFYSLPPTDFQRFLIPVYFFEGVVKTKLAEYPFCHFIVAVDITPSKIKALGVVDNPYACLIF
ncbi:MAG: hypothetical protein ACFE8J_16265 [Candidatus Heimdallarchaeota archaeon]